MRTMAALGRDDERLDPSTRVLTKVLTVLARISEPGCHGCQTLFIRSITIVLTVTQQKNKLETVQWKKPGK